MRGNDRRKLKIGQKVSFSKLNGVIEKDRPAIVIEEHPTYYIARVKSGYLECIPAYGPTEVRI